MRTIRVASVILLVAVGLSIGCSTKDLTRGKAEELISAKLSAPDNSATQLPATRDQVNQLFSQNLATPRVFGNITYAEPTPEGKKYFSEIMINPESGLYFLIMNHHLKKKLSKITGISDEGGQNNSSVKRVDYTWVYDMSDSSDVLKTIFKTQTEFNRHEIMQRYDDGWRIVQ